MNEDQIAVAITITLSLHGFAIWLFMYLRKKNREIDRLKSLLNEKMIMKQRSGLNARVIPIKP